MKKALSIALISLLLLNVMGYYAVLVCLEWQHERKAEGQLDRGEFSTSQTITIKFPLTLPYVPDARGFERVQGIFQHNGTFYRLVKQRYAADTLTIICVRDKETERLQRALDRYVSTLTDNEPEQKSDGKPVISFIKEYILATISLSPHTSGWQANLGKAYHDKELAAAYRMPIAHPPEIANGSSGLFGIRDTIIKKVQVPFGLGFLHLFYLHPSYQPWTRVINNVC